MQKPKNDNVDDGRRRLHSRQNLNQAMVVIVAIYVLVSSIALLSTLTIPNTIPMVSSVLYSFDYHSKSTGGTISNSTTFNQTIPIVDEVRTKEALPQSLVTCKVPTHVFVDEQDHVTELRRQWNMPMWTHDEKQKQFSCTRHDGAGDGDGDGDGDEFSVERFVSWKVMKARGLPHHLNVKAYNCSRIDVIYGDPELNSEADGGLSFVQPRQHTIFYHHHHHHHHQEQGHSGSTDGNDGVPIMRFNVFSDAAIIECWRPRTNESIINLVYGALYNRTRVQQGLKRRQEHEHSKKILRQSNRSHIRESDAKASAVELSDSHHVEGGPAVEPRNHIAAANAGPDEENSLKDKDDSVKVKENSVEREENSADDDYSDVSAPLSVQWLMLDAVSAQAAERWMPETMKLIRSLQHQAGDGDHGDRDGDGDSSDTSSANFEAFVFEKYNSVGFNSLPNKCVLYSGFA